MRLLLYILPGLLPALVLAAPTAPTDETDDCDYDETDVVDDVYNPGWDGPTNDASAGLGFEFESATFTFRNDGCSTENTNAARKSVVANREGDNWKLTADTGSDAGRLQAEYIVDGTKVKVGQDMAGPIGKDIFENLGEWKPWDSDDKTVKVADNECNPWTITSPKSVSGEEGEKIAGNIEWSPQVTAPMPLEGLYDLMKRQMKDHDANQAPTDSLTGVSTKYFNRHTVVNKIFLKSKPNGIDPDSVTNDVLAFLSLVVTYAKNAITPLQPDLSPKFFSTFMPRNTFTTLYNEVNEKLPGELWDIINVLVCYKKTSKGITIDKDFCSGKLAAPTPGSKLSGLQLENINANGGQGATMSIKEWIENMPTKDLITEFDKTIDGSIGGLGSKMEMMYGSDRKVPLFEFRDLVEVKTSEFESFMMAVDDEVKEIHQKYPDAPS